MIVTRVVAVDPERPDPGVIAEAAAMLKDGRLVAFPTETVYGLGARALDGDAVVRVFAAKGRPLHHPLIAHVDGEAAARRLASSWPELASRLARAFWPGPLTLIVPSAPDVPRALTGGGDSIAIRAPAHPVARALIVAVGEPVAAPSANRYQGLSPTTALHVQKSLDGLVELILDGGACAAGIESTVVDVRGRPRVLRPGALGLAALREVAPEIAGRLETAAPSAPRASPGMDRRHYAPRARLIIAETLYEGHRIACGLAEGGGTVGLILRTPPDRAKATLLDLSRFPTITLRYLPEDPPGYTRELFSALHHMDDIAVDAIVVESVPDGDAWWAVADRLRRGAAPKG